MMSEDFEWDDDKNLRNQQKHGVYFVEASESFEDPNATEKEDPVHYGEQRFLLVGASKKRLLAVVFTERDGRIRIISAREATSNERNDYLHAAQA
jgi:uncharacterized protein